MNKKQKLKKIIEYAKDNGWKYDTDYNAIFLNNEKNILFQISIKNRDYIKLLFDHSFAKAVFCRNRIIEYRMRVRHGHGDNMTTKIQTCHKNYKGRHFKHHLKEAVVSGDPIDYYYNFIKGVENAGSL